MPCRCCQRCHSLRCSAVRNRFEWQLRSLRFEGCSSLKAAAHAPSYYIGCCQGRQTKTAAIHVGSSAAAVMSANNSKQLSICQLVTVVYRPHKVPANDTDHLVGRGESTLSILFFGLYTGLISSSIMTHRVHTTTLPSTPPVLICLTLPPASW